MNAFGPIAGLLVLASAPAAQGAEIAPNPERRAARAESMVSLGIGIQKVLRVPGLTAIGVGNQDIIDARAAGESQVVVVGRSEGETTLLLFRRDRSPLACTVRVKQWEERWIDELADLVMPRPALKIIRIGDWQFFDGEITTLEELERVAAALELFPKFVKNRAHLDPDLVREALEQTNADLLRHGLNGVRATSLGGAPVLEGTVEHEDDIRKANAIAEAHLGALLRGMEALRKGTPGAENREVP